MTLLVPNRRGTTGFNLLATLLLEQTNLLMVFILLLTKTPKSFLAKLLFFLPLSLFTQIVLLLSVFTSTLEDLAFGFYELQKIPASPLLKAVGVCLPALPAAY